MITKNEEKYLPTCLDSVKDFVDEIIIVDTGSTDKTKDIAESAGAKVFSFEWLDDFATAKNFAVSKATSDWVLVIDADELLDEEGKKRIKELINRETPFVGFQLDQRSYLKEAKPKSRKNDSKFEPVEQYPFYISHKIVRLFKNGLNIYFKNRVHELAEHSIKLMKKSYADSGIIIHHFGSLKEENFINRKASSYMNIIMKQLEDEPENVRYLHQAGKACMVKNDADKAIEFFVKASKIDPDYKLIFSDIATAFMMKKDFENSINYYKKSLAQKPNHPSPANNLGVMYMQAYRMDLAKKVFEYALKKNPKNVVLRRNYARVLKSIKK